MEITRCISSHSRDITMKVYDSFGRCFEECSRKNHEERNNSVFISWCNHWLIIKDKNSEEMLDL